MKTKALIVLAAAMSLVAAAHSQNIHYGDSFELNETLVSNQSHEFTASSYIDLNRGFHSAPNVDKSTLLQIDSYGINPPETGITGGPNSYDTGAVGAIGGTVDVGSMGAAIYSIPIDLPAGINGMQPNLSITYNSQAGNGLLGWGWDLTGLSSIERTGRTRYHDGTTGAVTLNDNTDRYMLDGKRLIEVADYTDSIEFKTEQDEMSRIMAYFRFEQGGSGTIKVLEHFKVWKANGVLMEYGTSTDSRIDPQNGNPNALCWLLNRVSDRYGNSMVYHYNKNVSEGEFYISSINYTEHFENGNVVVTPEFTINFHYKSGFREDFDFSYVAGNLVQSRKLLDYLAVCRCDDNSELERYSFEYNDCVLGQSYVSAKMHHRLERVLYEKDGLSLNPTIINWSGNGSGVATNSVFMNEADTAIYRNYPFVGDFNGDGYSDLAVVPNMDSVYTHNVSIKFFLNNPTSPGQFAPFQSMTMQNVNKHLDWLYPVDLNDDGLDDLVACFYDSIANRSRDTMCIKIFENVAGTHFVFKDSVPVGGGRILVRTGDFMGRGDLQLLLLPVSTAPILPSLVFPVLYYYENGNLTQTPSSSFFQDVLDIATGDFDGDGHTDVMFVMETGSTVYSLNITGNTLSFQQIFATSEINHPQGKWNHVFTGDFNGDGKTDLLYGAQINNNNTRYKFFYSTGLSFQSTDFVDQIGTYELPSWNLFSNSLRKVMDAFASNGRNGVWSHSICVADFDGDGVTDVLGAHLRVGYYSMSVYSHYNQFSGKFQSIYSGGSTSGQNYINCRTQYFHPGYYLGKENVSFLGLEYRNTTNTHNQPGVFSLKPSSELNSVSSIVDGLGNATRLVYGYAMQPYLNLNYGVKRLPVPLRVLRSYATDNASGQEVKVTFDYADPYYHRDGHGWLGFRKTIRKTIENYTETVRMVSLQSLETMTSHAMLLPEKDTTFVFHNGSQVLSSVTNYQFEKACSSFGNQNPNHLVVCPALTNKTTINYNPDDSGQILSKTFVENYYNYNNGLYYHTYHCDSTRIGVGSPTSTSFGTSEFRNVKSTAYYSNNYSTWTINRPHDVVGLQSRNGKPDVSHFEKYEYTAANSYLPSRVYDSPSDISDHDPLMLRTDYEYYSDGNLREKVVLVPYGQFGEQQKTYEYEYGPDGQRRLVTNETVSSGGLSYATSYTYDDYDRIDTLTEANGLAKTFDSDAMGITSWIHNADSTKSCTALRWAQGHPLAPSGASYYRWSRSSDGKQTMTFYHKTGAELRSVTYGLRGEPIFTDRQYDNRGRLSAVSEPYKEGETVRWTVYGYDNIDRLTSVTTPDTTCTTTVYDGFRTETTVTTPQGLSQESAVTVNAMGWTVRSDDASGSYVVYDHYADGLMATATVNGNPATTVTASYDNARQRATLVDPDYGTLTTSYDAYGRLKQSVSPRELAAQTETANFYDGFDRLIQTTDGMENTRTDYTYNETGVTKGTLNEMRFRVQGGADIQRITYSYDTLARPVSATEQRATGSYTTNVEYDTQSRISRMVYPSGVAVRYGYQNGYWKSVFDDNDQLLWKTKNMDASGQLLEVELGNGAVTRHTYDTVMHRLRSIVTEKNLQNLTYEYDKFGNLAARKDHKKNLEETFTYDDMNRLTGITLKRSSGQDLNCAVVYDALGRMTSKQAVTAVSNVPQVSTIFSQPTFNASKVHALSTIQSTSDLFLSSAQVVTYTGFDKVRSVRNGNDSIRYTYGYDHQRIRMEERIGTSRTKDYVGSCEYVTETLLNTTTQMLNTYLVGPFGVFAVVTMAGDEAYHYVLKDNLGSWVAITDKNGAVVQQLSYDAWGNLRNPNNGANYTLNDIIEKPMFDRGFTGHEHLCHFSLINMNGRMYDPVTSSFLSADRYVQDPSSAQGFNRYAYCLYNPLRYVDPTGWRSGEGGSYSPDNPPRYVYMDDWSGYLLDEVTIVDSRIFHFEIDYSSHYNAGGGSDNQWNEANNGQPTGYKSGSGGGSGNHGGNNNNTIQSQNVNLETSSNIDLTPVNVSCFYLNSGNTLIGKGAEWASVISAGSKEVSVFEKIATHSKYLGIIGVGINIGFTTYQMYYGEMPKHEGVVRMGMTGVEFGLAYVPYVGPLLSIGLTAYDIGGGFDDNLYKTENWWKEKQP